MSGQRPYDVIPVPRLLGSRKKNGVIRVAPFLSSQCPDYLDPGNLVASNALGLVSMGFAL
ncbi:hypothetical protein [Wolbachia endosymbiont of Dactylopius coccus]